MLFFSFNSFCKNFFRHFFDLFSQTFFWKFFGHSELLPDILFVGQTFVDIFQVKFQLKCF